MSVARVDIAAPAARSAKQGPLKHEAKTANQVEVDIRRALASAGLTVRLGETLAEWVGGECGAALARWAQASPELRCR